MTRPLPFALANAGPDVRAPGSVGPFWISGLPATKGSAQPHGHYNPSTGKLKVWTSNDAGPKAKTWAGAVSWAAQAAMDGRAPFAGAVLVEIRFYLPRPKAHYRTNGQVKPNAPARPAKIPDGDKMMRCLWDALTGICFVDDGHIVEWPGGKHYANDGRVGASVRVEEI